VKTKEFVWKRHKRKTAVDLDFDPKGRETVIGYLKQRYGVEHVMQVSNHSELKAKAAIKDVARFYNYSFDESNAITDKIPAKFKDDGEMITPKIDDVIEMDEVKPFVEADPKLFEVAKALEGSYRQAGRHAGAVIITQKPVTEIIPVMRAPGDDDSFNLQTQWDKKQLESIGVHKYDILGLSTLTVIKKLEDMTGVKCLDIPMDDPKTWVYLRNAKNMTGIFQLGASASMRSWCRKVIPEYKVGMTGLVDYLSDINAINRPAVLDAGMGDKYVENKNAGRYDLPYDYPSIRRILDDTHGIILYQEQVMQLAKELAGFSLGKGDLLRRNLEKMGTPGKKDKKVIDENRKFRKEFIDGCRMVLGVNQAVAEGIFNWLSDSSGYGFNRSHSWTYSLIGYWTAYFKANFALEFYTVSINESIDKDDVRELLIREAQTNGIRINLPAVNRASTVCNVSGNAITYGLNMIKGLSEKVAELICAKTFANFSEFCDYVIKQPKLNKKHVQILIKLGYFDEFEDTKSLLWYEYQKAVWNNDNNKKKEEWQEKKTAGKRVREFNDLKFEYEELEGTPKQWLAELIGFQWETRLMEVLKELPEEKFNEERYVIGEISFVKSGISKFKKPWCLITLQTQDGDKKGFLEDATIRLRKGEVIVAQYRLKDDTYTFTRLERY
jgi:DNA polymerase-3 subunit alpha